MARSTRLLTLLGAALLAAACSGDMPSGPGAMRAPTQAAAAVLTSTDIDFKKLYPKMTVQIPSVTLKGDTTIQKFTVNPQDGKLIVFGKNSGNVVAIPANTLCDPKITAYGPLEWLLPCTLAKSSISFEVRTWNDEAGLPHADFYPDIRFNPSAAVPVRLYFQTTLDDIDSAYIPYCNALRICVNEGRLDAELETYVSPTKDGSNFWVYRTLRHFSGYVVAERGDGDASVEGIQ